MFTVQSVDLLRLAPEASSEESDNSELLGCVFVVARGNSTKVGDAVEEALDRTALAIKQSENRKRRARFGRAGVFAQALFSPAFTRMALLS